MNQNPPFEINWSSRLELLADALFDTCREKTIQGHDPFAKNCIVVKDMATRDWLQQYYLLDKKGGDVLLNLEFTTLSEFVNDWLGAQVSGISPRQRRPALHPYAKEVMTWRIYRILETDCSELAELNAYIGTDDKHAPLRRHALAEQLAQLYDEYLNSRFQMLRNWESGDYENQQPGVPSWQITLYRKLLAQESDSYATEYTRALQDDTDAAQAFQNGFPRYLSVNIFDIVHISYPTLCLLEKMATAMPITFWTFNPKGDWLAETQSLRETIRKARARLNAGKAADTSAGGDVLELSYSTPEERLLGALASGARALIGMQCDENDGDVTVLGEADETFSTLKDIAGTAGGLTVHRAYSPRRELESVKDSLHSFFNSHPEARPHDALVLCADWESYAPIIESVFSTDTNTEGYIPFTVAGNLTGETPVSRSFSDLLAFRNNRFEVNAVLSLLKVPAIQSHFGLDDNTQAILQDLVKTANIRWGLDDQDVAQILELEKPEGPYPFTWQRGLDRLVLDMLCGNSDADSDLISVGTLGELHPCGNVEDERSHAVSVLRQFVSQLAALRQLFKSGTAMFPTELKTALLDIIDKFYDELDDNIHELTRLRLAVTSVAESLEAAGYTAALDCEVFLTAVLSSIRNSIPIHRATADAVLFAPLKNASATPHRFVWICGLNDGKFPRCDHPASFNIIGKHPTLFDVTSRELDAYALLKACLGAREQLAFSHVGMNIHTNESVPPSVMLNELLDYFHSAQIPFISYSHPLQPYSARYFTKQNATGLPPSHSSVNLAIARTLAEKSCQPPPDGSDSNLLTAFDLNPDGPTVISADDLAEFYARPNAFLVKRRLGISTHWRNKIEDEDTLDVQIDKSLKTKLILDEEQQNDDKAEAKLLVETGAAPNPQDALTEIQNFRADSDTEKIRQRQLKFTKANAEANVPNTTLIQEYRKFLQDNTLHSYFAQNLQLEDGKLVNVPFNIRTISLDTQGGELQHTFVLQEDIYNSTKISAWIRHLAGHAAGLKFATVMFCQKNLPACTYRPIEQNEAIKKLQYLVQQACKPLSGEYPDLDKAASPSDDTPYLWEELEKEIEENILKTCAKGARI